MEERMWKRESACWPQPGTEQIVRMADVFSPADMWVMNSKKQETCGLLTGRPLWKASSNDGNLCENT